MKDHLCYKCLENLESNKRMLSMTPFPQIDSLPQKSIHSYFSGFQIDWAQSTEI